MSQSKITLIGIENYLNPDKSVFDDMQLPSDIDKETLIGAIMMRCQEFELLYHDPEFLTMAVKLWSMKHYRTFTKWVEALKIQYDPLYNYDRTEEYTDTHAGDFNRRGSNSDSGSSNNTHNVNLTTTDDTTNTHSEKAYNDSNYVGTSQDVIDSDVHNTGNTTDSNSYSNGSQLDETGKDNYTNVHKARLFGNIGVTTSQQMLQSELDIAEWNLYEHIADLFCEEFCIMVY